MLTDYVLNFRPRLSMVLLVWCAQNPSVFHIGIDEEVRAL